MSESTSTYIEGWGLEITFEPAKDPENFETDTIITDLRIYKPETIESMGLFEQAQTLLDLGLLEIRPGRTIQGTDKAYRILYRERYMDELNRAAQYAPSAERLDTMGQEQMNPAKYKEWI